MMLISTLSLRVVVSFANSNKVIIWKISLKTSSNPILPETEGFPGHSVESDRTLANWGEMLITPGAMNI